MPGLIGHVRSGKLKAIGIAAAKRHPLLPAVRTLAEQGLPGVDTSNWYALFVPAKTPAAVVDTLNEAIRRTLALPAVSERLLGSGTTPAPSTQQELSALLKRDTEKWGRLIRAKRISPDG